MMVIGFDTALSAFGYAVAEFGVQSPDTLDFAWLAAGVWTTKPHPEQTKKGVDLSVRWMELYRKARALVAEWRPDVLCVEAVAFPRGRVRWTTISALGRCRAIVDALAVERGCIVKEFAPVTIKKAVTGSAKASKELVEERLRFGRFDLGMHLDAIHADLREHAADAAASVYTARDWLERRASTWE